MFRPKLRPQWRSVGAGHYVDVMLSCDAIFQVGRQFTFSNGSITVNTGALIAAGALALLGKIF